MRSLRFFPALLLVLTAHAAAAREYSPGDHVRVLVINQSYAGVVTRVYRDTVYTIRYDAGYGDYATLLEYIQPVSGGQWNAHDRPSVGSAVKVKLGQTDYVAHVIATHEDDVYRVRYADGSEWDTLGDYMRPSGYYHAWSDGERVQVLWKGIWYDARIVRILGSDRYRVHYTGYGDNFDEDVPGERVRLLRREEEHSRAGISITIAPRARASQAAPVEYTFLGMDTKRAVPAIRFRIKVNTPKPIEEVDIGTKFIAGDGSVVTDTTVVWQNIVKSKREPIENGRSYDDTSYLYPKTARVESRLLRVVFTDGTRWDADH
jgi:hypothetical protein